MLKNIYIRKADETYWERAEALAAQEGLALSAWVSELIRARLISLGTGEAVAKTPAELVADSMVALARAQEMLSS